MGNEYLKRNKMENDSNTTITEPQYRLSILICTLIGREGLLYELTQFLEKQKRPEVEILIESDDGSMPIGAKRNLMIDKAKGEFVAFVDDDDWVSSDYVDDILAALEQDPDCVGICGEIKSDNTVYNGLRFEHSIEYAGWYTGADGVLYRTPNHLNPVKKEIASVVRFDGTKNGGEDYDYSQRLRPLLSKEIFVDKILYYYRLGMAGQSW